MIKKSIVWGTCWFNEKIELVIDFYLKSLKSLSDLNFNVVPIIFIAKLNCSKNEIKRLKHEISNILILENTTNIFPNKNYGIALISSKAKELKCDYTAIVDSDWDIKKNITFVSNTVLKLKDEKYDLIIPNINEAAGRSNLLIGKTVINLFYPDYKDIILTPFPGSLFSNTLKLYEIVNDKNYHYDWGGEWDIISIAIKKKLKILSPKVEVNNIRHRLNNSKMQDSFQIWRAVLSNDDILDRFWNLEKCSFHITKNNGLSKKILEKKYNIKEMINIINSEQSSITEKQILYMILFPLGYLIGEIDTIPPIDDENDVVYDKNELNSILDVALYCAKNSFDNCDIQRVHNICKNISGKYLSLWNSTNQKKAINNYKEY